MKTYSYINTIKNQEKPLKFLLAKLLMRLNLSQFFKIQRDGYSLRFYPSAYSRNLWINNKMPLPIIDLIHDYLCEGDYFVDIGANIGVISIESSLVVGSNGKVYAFEPHPKTFSFLKGNIKNNQITNIETFNMALGDNKGEIFFSNIRSDEQNCVIKNGDGIKVPMYCLDDIINIPKISLLKIDVEGYEKFVLLGAAKTLNITECICFEALEKGMKRYNYSIDDIFEILRRNSFKLFRIVDKRKIVQITHTYKPKDFGEDLLAIKNVDDFLKRTGYKDAS